MRITKLAIHHRCLKKESHARAILLDHPFRCVPSHIMKADLTVHICSTACAILGRRAGFLISSHGESKASRGFRSEVSNSHTAKASHCFAADPDYSHAGFILSCNSGSKSGHWNQMS